MPSFSRAINGMRIAAKFPAGYCPSWYADFFGDMTLAYFYCATKPKHINLDKLSEPFAKMVTRYYEVNKLPFTATKKQYSQHSTNIKYPQDPKKIAIMMSGGKDSVHLMLKLIEAHGAENIFAVYVANLNRSETYYETRAVMRICDKLKVKYKIVRPINSVKLNRTGHNIALREELCVTLALPYLIHQKIQHVYFGSFNSFRKIDPIMYCSSKECLEFLNQYLSRHGIKFEFHNHIFFNSDSHIGIFQEMIEKYKDILDMTSSCYTQLNFREHRYELFKKKVPHIPIYNGCGSCIKCLRINSAILLFAKFDAPITERAFLFDHLTKFQKEKYPSDTSLNEHITALRKRQSLASSTERSHQQQNIPSQPE